MPTEAERRVYTPEFKAAAVQLHRGGQSLEEVASALDVPEPLIRTWVLQAEMNDPVPSRTGAPQPRPAVVTRASSNGLHCAVCGRAPALAVSLRSVTGIVIAFRMRRVQGTFCRDCGTAVARRTLNRTLLSGWWGLFAGIANIYAAIVDASALGRFRRLPEPDGEPRAEPLHAGATMFRRAGVYVGGVVLLLSLLVSLTFVGVTTDLSRFNGKCVAFAETKIVAKPSCGDSHDGRVVAVVANKAFCPQETDATMRPDANDGKLLCIDLDQ
jgi:transposase-like protein